MTVTCFKGILNFGYVANTYEVDESFVGLIIDNDGVKKKLHYPFKLHIYDNDVVVKDIDGKSYRVPTALVEVHNTVTKLLNYINNCFSSNYHEEWYDVTAEYVEPTGSVSQFFIDVDSIKSDWHIYVNGVKQQYVDTLDPSILWMHQYTYLQDTNRLYFGLPLEGSFIEINHLR